MSRKATSITRDDLDEVIIRPHLSRHHAAALFEEQWDERTPRLGRRESEPHSHEITYLYDVLSTNFPNDRAMWGLHHYFHVKGIDIDIQFDVSYFRDFQLPQRLSSYDASKHGGRVPTMAVNILSKSTYNQDIGLNVDRCRLIGIPVYIVFNPYLPRPRELKAPLLRVYYFPQDEDCGSYHVKELRTWCIEEADVNSALMKGEPIKIEVDPTKIIDVRPDLLPFKFGIMKTDLIYDEDLPEYRIILIDRDSSELLLTKEEKERQRAERERQRADNAERRVKELEMMLERMKGSTNDSD